MYIYGMWPWKVPNGRGFGLKWKGMLDGTWQHWKLTHFMENGHDICDLATLTKKAVEKKCRRPKATFSA
jgi:hypothetical protein